MRRLSMILFFLICVASSATHAQPKQQEYSDCAAKVAEAPGCAVQIALGQLPPEDFDRIAFNELATLFRRLDFVDRIDAASRDGRLVHEIAEDWIIDRILETDQSGDDRPSRQRQLIRLMPRLAYAGFPRAIRAMLPPEWTLHPANVCSSEVYLGLAHAILGEISSATKALERSIVMRQRAKLLAGSKLPEFVQTGWQRIKECPQAQIGYEAAFQIIALGDLEVGLRLLEFIAPSESPPAFIFIVALAGVAPEILAELKERAPNPTVARMARHALVIALADVQNFDAALKAMETIRDDPNRGWAMLGLVSRLVAAGLISEAKELTEHDPMIDAAFLESIVELNSITRSSQVTRPPSPLILAIDGRYSEALNLVAATDTGASKHSANRRVSDLLAIYLLAEAARKR